MTAPPVQNQNVNDQDDENDTGLDTGAVADEGDDDDSDDWSPPSKQDWDNVQKALKKARQDARAARRNAKSGASGSDTEGQEASEDEVRARIAAEVEGKYKPVVVRSAARAAFVEAGLNLSKGDASMGRVLRMLDMDDIDVDENGDVTGLEEQIEDIKADFPELFAAPTSSRRPAGSVDGGSRDASGVKKAKSAAERLADSITGGSRR